MADTENDLGHDDVSFRTRLSVSPGSAAALKIVAAAADDR
jgi:hypothetical protein